jgi:predicted nucleic acid-binding Zn ribbon protein
MTEKIPQHKHCHQCGRAFIGETNFCSDDCGKANTITMKKKKRQLLLLYVVTFVVLILALFMTSL